MSRFANPEAVGRFVLGPCECPGKPHDEDWMEFRTELGAGDMVAFANLTGVDAVAFLLVRWNLLEDDGSAAEANRTNLARLYTDTFDQFNEWLNANVRVATLPNGSGARSLTGTRVSASRTPPTQRRG